MKFESRYRDFCSLVLLPLAVSIPTIAQEVSFDQDDGRLAILVDGTQVATYVWQDAEIPRPYFCNIVAPNGTQVSRTHPPDPVADAGNDDHPEYHPGIWLAFGDINGQDFWRNKARVRHVAFVTKPTAEGGVGRFAVRNVYESAGQSPEAICEERCDYTFHVMPWGYLFTSDSTFEPVNGPVVFGDQEEMGFGVRMATPLSVKHGEGALRNSNGGRNEAGTWGKVADWCAGFARIGDTWLGMSVMAHPDNFRPSWFHSRDYGLIVANPFGKKAMTGPNDPAVPPDQSTVEAGDTLRLRFAVAIFSLPGQLPPNLTPLFRDYVLLVTP